MPRYRVCDNCGASLDPQESCDCKREREAPRCNGNAPQAKHGFYPRLYIGYGPGVKTFKGVVENVK